LKIALQETVKGFLQSGNSINLKPEQVAAVKSLLNRKDVLAVLPTVFGKRAIFQFFVCVKEYMSKDLDSVCILVDCLLQSLMEDHTEEARSMGLTVNSLPEALLEFKKL